MARKIFLKLRQEKGSLVIQRLLRIVLSRNRVLRLRKEKGSVEIQRYLRRVLAFNRVKELIREKILKAKTYVALKL